jgi:hypothetical protein
MKTIANYLCLVCDQPRIITDWEALYLDETHELIYTLIECGCGTDIDDIVLYTNVND